MVYGFSFFRGGKRVRKKSNEYWDGVFSVFWMVFLMVATNELVIRNISDSLYTVADKLILYILVPSTLYVAKIRYDELREEKKRSIKKWEE